VETDINHANLIGVLGTTYTHANIDTHIAGTGAAVHGDSYLLNSGGDQCDGQLIISHAGDHALAVRSGVTDYFEVHTDTGQIGMRINAENALGYTIWDGTNIYDSIDTRSAQPARVFNDGGADIDYRVEGSGAPNAFFIQGSSGNVGLGTNAPRYQLEMKDSGLSSVALSDSDIAHGITGWAETDVFFKFGINHTTSGGCSFLGITDDTSASATPLAFTGFSGHANPTVAPVIFRADKKSGTSTQVLADDEKAFEFFTKTTSLMTVMGSGCLAVGGNSNLSANNKLVVDFTGTEAVLIRKASDGGDVFAVDTSTSLVTITGRETINTTFNTEIGQAGLLIYTIQNNSTANWCYGINSSFTTYDVNAACYAHGNTMYFENIAHSNNSGVAYLNALRVNGTGTISSLIGVSSTIVYIQEVLNADVTVTTCVGYQANIRVNTDHGSGEQMILTNGYDAFQSTSGGSTGQITTTDWMVGFRAKDLSGNGGSISYQAGVYIEDLKSANNDYGVYIEQFTSGYEIWLAGTGAIYFRHQNAYINSTSDGKLELNATAYVLIKDNLDISTKNIITDTTTGTQIATGATQKLGFFGTTPAVQQAHEVDADGTLADITTKFNSLLSKLETLGLLASA
jgi:hypothetical protein